MPTSRPRLLLHPVSRPINALCIGNHNFSSHFLLLQLSLQGQQPIDQGIFGYLLELLLELTDLCGRSGDS